MPQPQFIPSPLKIIERRRCQNCGATMMMTGIEPIGLGTDRRTFECDQCGHEEELVVNSNYNSTLSAGLAAFAVITNSR
jgi:hypothetical protein